MPDAWELAHRLDPNAPEDRNRIVPASVSQRHAGYTYVEFYINELADALMGVSGPTHVIKAKASPADAGTVVAEHGNIGWEVERDGGYNAPYWFGKVEFGKAQYNQGSMAVMKAKPKPGFAFSHWTGGAVTDVNSPIVSFPVTSAVTMTANFVTTAIHPPVPVVYTSEVLIDDFNDRDADSFLINSEGKPKKWKMGGMYFHEVAPGNWALTSRGRQHVVAFGIDRLDHIPEQATAEIPDGAVCLKFKVYNLGIMPTKLNEFRGGWDHVRFVFDNTAGEEWRVRLYYARPFQFPVIKPGESGVFTIPLALIKSKDQRRGVLADDKFRYFWLGQFLTSQLWGSQVAIDDVAWGIAGDVPSPSSDLEKRVERLEELLERLQDALREH